MHWNLEIFLRNILSVWEFHTYINVLWLIPVNSLSSPICTLSSHFLYCPNSKCFVLKPADSIKCCLCRHGYRTMYWNMCRSPDIDHLLEHVQVPDIDHLLEHMQTLRHRPSTGTCIDPQIWTMYWNMYRSPNMDHLLEHVQVPRHRPGTGTWSLCRRPG